MQDKDYIDAIKKMIMASPHGEVSLAKLSKSLRLSGAGIRDFLVQNMPEVKIADRKVFMQTARKNELAFRFKHSAEMTDSALAAHELPFMCYDFMFVPDSVIDGLVTITGLAKEYRAALRTYILRLYEVIRREGKMLINEHRDCCCFHSGLRDVYGCAVYGLIRRNLQKGARQRWYLAAFGVDGAAACGQMIAREFRRLPEAPSELPSRGLPADIFNLGQADLPFSADLHHILFDHAERLPFCLRKELGLAVQKQEETVQSNFSLSAKAKAIALFKKKILSEYKNIISGRAKMGVFHYRSKGAYSYGMELRFGDAENPLYLMIEPCPNGRNLAHTLYTRDFMVRDYGPDFDRDL